MQRKHRKGSLCCCATDRDPLSIGSGGSHKKFTISFFFLLFWAGGGGGKLSQCRKTTQQTFLVSFLHGLYLTCTREDAATVTPASVAKQHNKPFRCLFCLAILHMYTGRPRDRNTPVSQNNTTNLSCVFSAWVIPHMYRGRTPRP